MKKNAFTRQVKKKVITILGSFFIFAVTFSQEPTIAVLNFDTRGIEYDPVSMGNIVRLEVLKSGSYKVFDKYEVEIACKKAGIDISNCFAQSCLIRVGEELNADKVLSGRVEKYDKKIVIILRLMDIKTRSLEKTNIMEYMNMPEIEKMVNVSVDSLFGKQIKKEILKKLLKYDEPIASPKTQLKLNGPRLGVSIIGGKLSKIVQKPKNQGGYNMVPVTSHMGYQHEVSYLSSGRFQALVEFLFLASGLEQNRFVPQLLFMNGFRDNRTGFELGFGPLIEIIHVADGYYDDNNKWHLPDEWTNLKHAKFLLHYLFSRVVAFFEQVFKKNIP